MTFSTIPDVCHSDNVDLHREASCNGAMSQAPTPQRPPTPHLASGAKAKARAILAAIRTLQAIEQGQRPATSEERQVLGRFPGFGPVLNRLAGAETLMSSVADYREAQHRDRRVHRARDATPRPAGPCDR